ncbi:MAG: type II secretion system protein [Pelomonas sp.]|nr:type II secretion system protein [Roseateles sp.]
MKPLARSRRGFTLIEMLVVLAIVAMLVGVARPVLELSVQRTQEYALRSALRTLRGAIDAYKHAADEGRIARAADASGYPPDLASLVKGVKDVRSPDGSMIYFLRSLPRDPFADPGQPAEQTWAPRAYDSPPDAPRPGRDVFDVHSQSERRAIDGSFYKDW